MLEHTIEATWIDAHGSVAHCEDAEVRLDMDVSGSRDAFNPAEMLLASLAGLHNQGNRARGTDTEIRL